MAVAAFRAHDGPVRAEVVVIPGCPHESAAKQLLRTALTDIGLGHVPVLVRVIASERAPGEFAGSPTFAVDGRDLFPPQHPAGALACRVYDGPGRLPELRDLRQALKEAVAIAMTT